VAVERVRGEPVSGPNSLLTGKNTGNFTRFDSSNRTPFQRNPHPEPFSRHLTHPVLDSEQGI
jgi:hypothetical protein